MYLYKIKNLLVMSTTVVILICLTISISSSCSTISLRERADSLFLITDNVYTYYDLKKPETKYFLPYALSEISGITLLNDTSLLCIEDERGRVYEYNLHTRKITNAIHFSDPGDFEGIEVVNDTIYVLESDGDIYEFSYTNEDHSKPIKYENPLRRKNDTEGLGFNPNTGNLMIACKEEQDIKGVNAKGKTVYEFDIKNKKLIHQPIFDLTAEHMDTFFEANRDYTYDQERIKFEPSAIAHNPIDGYFYLLASVGKMLIVLNSTGTIKATYPIVPRILSQPEGIAFDSQGNLYISSEGEGDRGYILKFNPKHK